MNTKKTITSIAITLMLIGCTPPTETPAPPQETPAIDDGAVDDPGSTRPFEGSLPTDTMDARLAQAAARLPGFGGLYRDDDTLVVLMVPEPGRAGRWTEDEVTEIEAVLYEIFGRGILASPGVRREEAEAGGAFTAPAIRIVEAKHPIVDLLAWRERINDILAEPGTILTDVDEALNRVRIEVESEEARRTALGYVEASGLDPAAFLVEIGEPIELETHSTLRQRHRAVPGGMQIAFGGGLCSLTFNARRQGVDGFLTNSHCTNVRSVVEGTQIFQEDANPASDLIGTEIADPPFFTFSIAMPLCPAGRRCRFSDSAFIDYSVERGEGVARTPIWNTGSVTVSTANPIFDIVGTDSSWPVGTEMDKVGRTTGWTYGLLNTTCANTNVVNTDITLLCQNRVQRLSGGGYQLSAGGDSGSPWFYWMGSEILVTGIHWGGAASGASSVYSPLNLVELELGELERIAKPKPVVTPAPFSCDTCDTLLDACMDLVATGEITAKECVQDYKICTSDCVPSKGNAGASGSGSSGGSSGGTDEPSEDDSAAQCLGACAEDRDLCMALVAEGDGKPQDCVLDFKICKEACDD